jgi:tetratricopeptide (TPR) repeat protein
MTMTEMTDESLGSPEASAGRPPWSPTGIALITILLSPIPGGIVHALNERRLGREDRWRGTLYGNLAAGLVVLGLALAGGPGRLLSHLLSLLIGVWFYKSQTGAFARHLGEGGRKAPFTVPLLIALSFVVLVLGGGWAYVSVTESLSTDRIVDCIDRGNGLMDEARYSEAAEVFEQCKELSPNLPEGYWNLAVAHLRLGELAEAKAELEALLEIAPDYGDTKKVLAAIDKELSGEGSAPSTPPARDRRSGGYRGGTV